MRNEVEPRPFVRLREHPYALALQHQREAVPDVGAALVALHAETERLLIMYNRDGHLWTPSPARLPPGLERLPLMAAEVLVAAARGQPT